MGTTLIVVSIEECIELSNRYVVPKKKKEREGNSATES